MTQRIMRVVLRRLDGKRGRFLVIHTIIFTAVGVSYIQVAQAPSRVDAFAWLPDWLPLWWLGFVWIAAACVALYAAAMYNPPRSDRAGFMAITAVPLLWGLMFLVSWVFGFSATAWVSAVTWFGIAAIAMQVSSWANPIPAKHIPTSEGP